MKTLHQSLRCWNWWLETKTNDQIQIKMHMNVLFTYAFPHMSRARFDTAKCFCKFLPLPLSTSIESSAPGSRYREPRVPLKLPKESLSCLISGLNRKTSQSSCSRHRVLLTTDECYQQLLWFAFSKEFWSQFFTFSLWVLHMSDVVWEVEAVVHWEILNQKLESETER